MGAVDPVGEDVTQLGKALARGAQQRPRRRADAGCWPLDLADQQKTLGGDDVGLRPLMRLPASTLRGPPFSVVRALWRFDDSRGLNLTPHRLSNLPDLEPTPSCHSRPAVEIALHRGAWRKSLGQNVLLTAGGQDVTDRIEDRTKVDRRSNGRGLGSRPSPVHRLRVVTWITKSVMPIIPPSGSSVCDDIDRQLSITTTIGVLDIVSGDLLPLPCNKAHWRRMRLFAARLTLLLDPSWCTRCSRSLLNRQPAPTPVAMAPQRLAIWRR